MMNGIEGVSANIELNKIFRENPMAASRLSDAEHITANSPEIKSLKRAGIIECQTCANRKYQDGSDEMVSFKSATHISPQESATRVMAHEHEHVTNAYSDAEINNGKVINASVTLKSSICPECGRSYIAGGLTSTQIKYNTDNPYDAGKKNIDAEAIAGNHIDYEG